MEEFQIEDIVNNDLINNPEGFMEECEWEIPEGLITNIAITTTTLKAKFSGVKFNENEMETDPESALYLKPDKKLVYGIISNHFTRLVVDDGAISEDINLSAKEDLSRIIDKQVAECARRKTKPKKKLRKMQGNGSSFNSQITFILKYKDKCYKPKLFRNGSMTIPGIHPRNIQDLKECIFNFSDYLKENKEILCNGEVKCEEIIPVLKNYKAIIRFRAGHNAIDLNELANIINEDMIEILSEFSPLKICACDYNRTLPRPLTIKFNTPLPWIQSKLMRVEIYARGKINIKGGLYIGYTKNVLFVLNMLFEKYYDDICYTDPVAR